MSRKVLAEVTAALPAESCQAPDRKVAVTVPVLSVPE